MTDFETIFLQKNDIEKWEQRAFAVPNRGYLFGDGLFETMVFDGSKIRFSNFHQHRIEEGCRVLGFDIGSLSSIADIERHVGGFSSGSPLRIRWNVHRKGLGKYTPETDSISETLILQEFRAAVPTKQSAYFSREFFVPKNPWSHCKTLNALPYVLANRERQRIGMDEVILLDASGFIAEAGAANIFWEKDGKFYTPSLACACIDGVGRNVLLNHFQQTGASAIEGKFKQDDLMEAQRVFVSNVTGISYIQEIEGRSFDPTRIESLDILFH